MLNFVTGDVTKSDVKGKKILPHVVNSSGMWGSGVVIPIGIKWPNVRQAYLDWYNTTIHNCEYYDCEVPWLLGETQFVAGDNDFIIANMLAQKEPGFVQVIDGFKWPPLRYEALQECMQRVAQFAKEQNASIVAPWFGTLRAGGSKHVIKEMIEKIWSDVNVTMYEFEEK